MASTTAPATTPQESSAWKWWICTLLLLATTLNYMDRQALSQMSSLISDDFGLNNQQYSQLIFLFNVGFGLGALLFGYLVDKVGLRWLYAGLVIAWSSVGFSTGFVRTFEELLVCRLLLGIFEAGNWPCGILTVKRVLKPEARSLGNGMFQSGTALGAIITPLVVLACLKFSDPSDMHRWQLPFRIIGVVGVFWALLWFSTVRAERLAPPPSEAADASKESGSYWDLWRNRRFLVMLVVIIAVNAPWRSFVEWMPKFLKHRGYPLEEIQLFSSLYYLAADVGSIGTGLLTIWLVRRGKSLFASRILVFALCASLTALSIVAVLLPPGLALFAVLLLIAFGTLGSFSTYFAFSQEVSAKHQGKVTGTLGLFNAACMGGLALLQGWLIDYTGSYTLALGLTGVTPLMGVAIIYFYWQAPVRPPAEIVE